MRLVITRPAGDATPWVSALQAAGHEALVLPLIEIAPVADPQAVQEAWTQWLNFQAVMFVSAQAVRYFFAKPSMALGADTCQATRLTTANGPRCWATGPGTRKALLNAGIPAARIDSPPEHEAQFDSEALWRVVAPQVQALTPFGPLAKPVVLIVRGSDEDTSAEQAKGGSGRDWLTQQLQGCGVAVSWVAAYARSAPVWTPAQREQAEQAATDGSVWCFSSSQAISHLQQLLPAQNWAQTRCIATHARIAQSAQAIGFGEVHAARPLVADVVASLESLA
ncbi:HemD Uroporphyrinogen-III synthase [Burkholderiaceae bacterium]